MRRAGFYPKMAAMSIRKNGKYYIPYFLSCMICVAMFYIMLYLNGSDGLNHIRGTAYVQSMLVMGAIVIGLFSAIVLFYTNSFLMKRRRKELGLYNILGMESRHIGIIMLWETVFSALIGIMGGLLCGMLFSKLMLLLLLKLIKETVYFGFELSFPGVIYSVIIFGLIFLLNLLVNLARIRRSNGVELLKSENTGEREPKTRWLLTLIGILTMGGGYVLAQWVGNPSQALTVFFVAVILVIIGTYCLFVSGSIAVLKLLRRNKHYYYKTNNFISLSGMLHRMKRNAAGLASICILSTMVLVTISTTLSMYLGSQDYLSARYPSDIKISIYEPGEDFADVISDAVQSYARDNDVAIENLRVETSIDTSVRVSGSLLERIDDYILSDDTVVSVWVIDLDSYNLQTDSTASLERGEVLFQPLNTKLELPDSFTIAGEPMTVKERIMNFKRSGDVTSYVTATFMFVLNHEDMAMLYDALSDNGRIHTNYIKNVYFDVDLDREEQIDFYFDIMDHVEGLSGNYTMPNGEIVEVKYSSMSCAGKANEESEFNAMYGGFFFLGVFLGLLFAMATVLIIYYKQISEGYDDAERFKIMRQVGLGEGDIRSSIRRQILTVFFLPLVVAGIHVAAAFNLITQLLNIFSLDSILVFALCSLSVFLMFALLYTAIYLLTAKAYYKIVKG